jgi:hypothetical protein
MDQTTIQTIESLFQEKALLYAHLVECFKKERAYLTTMEFEPLWSVSDEKNRLCLEIETLRSRIASAADPGNDMKCFDVNRILDAIPPQQQGSIRNAILRIGKLKKEVEIMRRENQAFIDESLDFLDEMISILTGQGDRQMMYNSRSRLHRAEAVVTMRREV